jgi:hypothetical protein
MNSFRRDFNEVNYLIELAIEGSISLEQSRLLNQWIVNDPAIRRYYCEYIQLTVCIEQLSANISKDDLLDYDMIFDQEWWNQLAREEKTAPELEVPLDQSRHELIQKVIYPPREKRKLSKFSIFMLLNTAAIVLLFILLRFTPPKEGFEVATLTDSLNAKWANVSIPMQKGARITTGNEQLLLCEGYVELLFDNHARVTVEGPAEFQILAEDRIGINYGKVYSSVPKDAIGFSVYTQNAKIIDMGTEFGVLAEVGGNTQLHVLKGKTILMAKGSGKVNVEVNEGAAKKVSGDTGEISDMGCRTDYFVRTINSESNLIWKGQNTINLADIVGGGSGFGTGTLDRAIDPVSGKAANGEFYGRYLPTLNDYRPSALSPYIDGTFIPNGQTPQVVSSQGHLFRECPVTDGSYSQSIRAFTNYDCMVLENVSDNNAQTPFLYLHANMGITFDLEAIRRSLPGVKIARFQSQCGIRKYAGRPSASNADFWVLVDGTVRFKQQQVKTGGLYPIEIELSENDRFLTLVETDGGDPEGRILEGEVLPANDSDWGVFVDPVLVLESR